MESNHNYPVRNLPELIPPSSFITPAYVPSIKNCITVGTSIVSCKMTNGVRVGRIIKILNNATEIPTNEAISFNEDTNFPQFLVNIFLKKEDLPINNDDSRLPVVSTEIALTNYVQWNAIDSILGIAFVFLSSDIDENKYDCFGMENCFTVKHFFDYETGKLSKIGPNEFFSFPSNFPNFYKYVSECYATKVWDGLESIKIQLIRILCRTALSQGNNCQISKKIQFPRSVWAYIKLV